ncbi:MAG: hypothetical protein HYR88_00690 [Verrucomicrobia bacterium]|nr:hypothetical protein [Verrucomicrobiota bacterium]MBI3870093.1 hypothetical protein [Verrucomicrobiota bacterium]
MKRLSWINLGGVLALCALCVGQWQQNRALNLELNQQTTERLAVEARASEYTRRIAGLEADLAQLKSQWAERGGRMESTQSRLAESEQKCRRLALECDQLQASVAEWSTAVKERDARLTAANGSIQQLAADLRVAIQRFNNLATNHNAAVKELNEFRTRATSPAPPRTSLQLNQ